MGRSRGALSQTALNSEYSYQVMLRLTPATRKLSTEIAMFARDHHAYGLHEYFRFEEEDAEYCVYCFPTFIEAELFANAYGGEFLSSADRQKGNWRPRSRVGGEHVRTGYR